MNTSPTPQYTDFSRDVIGRYVCNSLEEAFLSMDPNDRPDAGRGPRPDARPFDIIVVGGGTFGAAVAQHLFANDILKKHRILVLEAGPFTLPEHVQNLPMIGYGSTADAKTSAQLRQMSPKDQQVWSKEVWGLPWNSTTPFPGLAYALAGRSLYWGGWSPQLLDAEMPQANTPNPWPAVAVDDLKNRYFKESARQIGTTETNDFIHGPLHSALRQMLADNVNSVTDAMPLNSLPTHPGTPGTGSPAEQTQQMLDLLGLRPTGGPTPPLQNLVELAKLEAPLAVESRARTGCFPPNKFSSMPLLMKAARQACDESPGDDVRKRLMVVPKCHVKRLITSNGRVTGVETGQGTLPVPGHGSVIIALGTIESTRLAKASFGDAPNSSLIGQNLMAHLRSNLDIRIPRASLPAGLPDELQASALFVKGRHQFNDGTAGHFHLQITASGLGASGSNSEAELFKKIPDIDGMGQFATADDQSVVITIRGIGEMAPRNPNSNVTLDLNPGENDEFSQRRAYVNIQASDKDRDLWRAMDRASDDVARIFANGQGFEVFTPRGIRRATAADDLALLLPYMPKNDQNNPGRRDGLGTTHHETGTLWMGTDPMRSVTNSDGRFHFIDNAYVAGPALFPTIGSPNPMLTGIALARRLADMLIPPAPQPIMESGFQFLFDGTEKTFNRWKKAGRGDFVRVGRALVAQPGDDLGLLYYPVAIAGDFTLRLQFQLENFTDNSGVFLRSWDPARPVPDRNDPNLSHPYQNAAYVPVDTGFEVQIDELARGNPQRGQPDGMEEHRTAAIYGIPVGIARGEQRYRRGPILEPGRWYDVEIEVIGQTYTVRLNGQQTTLFTNTDSFRGRSWEPTKGIFSGFVGLQTHTGRVAFANVRCCAGKPGQAMTQPMRIAVGGAPATVEFLQEGREIHTGYLVQGGRVVIQYALDRIPSPRPRRSCVAYARFLPGGQICSANLLQTWQGDPTRAASPPKAIPVEFKIPNDAQVAEIWFQHIDDARRVSWDSQFGQNFRFGVMRFAPQVPEPVVDYRMGAVPRRDAVNVFDEAAIRRQQKVGKGKAAEQTELTVKAWVRGEPTTKNVWADMHVFDRKDRLITSRTVPLHYEAPAQGEGEIFAFNGTIDPQAVSAAGQSDLPESRKIQYRVYYEVNNQIYTDGDLHQLEVEDDTKS